MIFFDTDVTKRKAARHLCEHQSKQRILAKGAGGTKVQPESGYQP